MTDFLPLSDARIAELREEPSQGQRILVSISSTCATSVSLIFACRVTAVILYADGNAAMFTTAAVDMCRTYDWDSSHSGDTIFDMASFRDQ